jgi:hypothetical protein
MFDFLKRLRGEPSEAAESQRARFERLVEELNAEIAELPEKPAVTITPETGALSFEMPEQFPDEALALPKPDSPATAPKPEDAEDTEKAEAKAE